MATALKNLLSKTFSTNHQWKYQLLRNWGKIIGPLSTKVRIEKIVGNVLVLGVPNSCWMQELYLLSPLLLKTINQNLDKPYIKEIRFKKIGTSPALSTRKKVDQHPNLPKEIQLTERQKKALAQIADAQLREVLEQFLKRCYGEKK